MKRLAVLFVVVTLLVSAPAALAAPLGWDAFVIRNATSGGAPPVIIEGATTAEFLIVSGGQKAALGSDFLSGYTLSQIGTISIDRLDDYTRFTEGSGPAVAPYINMWITDGTNYAVIANEPSNPEWAGSIKWDMTWDILSTKTVKVYENADKTWLPNGGVDLTFNDLASFMIMAPTPAQLAAGWTGLGTGAPREYGTNVAYGFNWVFGDTLSNYVSGDPGFQVGNPVAAPVPEPASLLLFGTGLVGLAKLRKRRR